MMFCPVPGIFVCCPVSTQLKGAVSISRKQQELQEGLGFWVTLLTPSHGHYWSSRWAVGPPFAPPAEEGSSHHSLSEACQGSPEAAPNNSG